MKPPPGKRRRHGRTMVVLVVVSFISLWKSTYRVGDVVPVIGYGEYPDDEKPSREELEFTPNLPGISEFGAFPRIHFLDGGWRNSSENINATTPAKEHTRKLRYPLSTGEALEQAYNGSEVIYRDFERDWFTKCEPVQSITIRPTCNALHEMNAFESPSVELLSMEGSWRSVWKVIDVSGHSTILKMLQLDREYTEESFSAHEMDAKVMERLTGSRHVVSSYGFCGQSVMTQIAESSGSKVIKDPSLSWRERLIMGRDIAVGLTELHALEPWRDYEQVIQHISNSSQPTLRVKAHTPQTQAIFAHHDINAANMISLSPKQVHWNDFNLGMISKKDPNTGKACPVPVRYEGTLWRSPEEIQNYLKHVPAMQPADVYAFGTLLFTVFTKHQPWTHLEDEEVTDQQLQEKKKQGALPNLPPKYQPERAEAKILWAATQACFRRDARDRPTAHRIALSLGLALQRIQTRKELSDDDVELLFIV